MESNRPVTKSEFFAHIMGLTEDCHPHILPGRFPYTSVFKLRHSGKELGRIVGKETGQGPDEYYLTSLES